METNTHDRTFVNDLQNTRMLNIQKPPLPNNQRKFLESNYKFLVNKVNCHQRFWRASMRKYGCNTSKVLASLKRNQGNLEHSSVNRASSFSHMPHLRYLFMLCWLLQQYKEVLYSHPDSQTSPQRHTQNSKGDDALSNPIKSKACKF